MKPTNEQLFEDLEGFLAKHREYEELHRLSRECEAIAEAMRPREPEIITTTGDLPPGVFGWIEATPVKPGDVIRFSPSPLHVACGIAGEWVVQERAPVPVPETCARNAPGF